MQGGRRIEHSHRAGTHRHIRKPSRLVGVATVYGVSSTEKLITPGNAKPGDLIFCTKPLGLRNNHKLLLNPQEPWRKNFSGRTARRAFKSSSHAKLRNRGSAACAKLALCMRCMMLLKAGLWRRSTSWRRLQRLGLRLIGTKFPSAKNCWHCRLFWVE